LTVPSWRRSVVECREPLGQQGRAGLVKRHFEVGYRQPLLDERQIVLGSEN
jgi:hypothetical protein